MTVHEIRVVGIFVALAAIFFGQCLLYWLKKPRRRADTRVCCRCFRAHPAVDMEVSMISFKQPSGYVMICVKCWDRLTPQKRFELCVDHLIGARAMDKTHWLLQVADVCKVPHGQRTF